MARIDKLFKHLQERGGSDLHLVTGLPPKIRLHGQLETIKKDPLSAQKCEAYLQEICTPRQWKKFLEERDLDFAYSCEGVARFRCNYFGHEHGHGGIFRIIPTDIKTLEDLDLPKVMLQFCQLRSGLVLVTGPTGSGKSTTLACLIDYINRKYRKRIITIEDPVEFSHKNKKSIIVHRELGADTPSFSRALMAATRQDPDVILVGEMRDLETISLAITAAEMGKLVLGTLHTNNAAKTIDRIIDVFPEDSQSQIRTQLAESLKGVVSQLLCRTVDGKGRVVCNEILIGSSALASVIRQGSINKIVSIIEGGRGDGMQLMDDALMAHFKAKRITGKEAYMKANDKKKFQQYVKDDELV